MPVKFWIDGKEYSAPEWWMNRQIRARKALGANPTQASIEAMNCWASQQEKNPR